MIMTIYEKAKAYCKYCVDNGYTCDIFYDVALDRFHVFTAGGTRLDVFYSVGDLREWLSERYDDEVDAGNIKLPYEPAKVEVFHRG